MNCVRRPVFVGAGIAGLLALLAGCQQKVYFSPTSHRIGLGADMNARARYNLATVDGQVASATFAAQGLEGRPNGPADQQLDRLVVTVALHNRLKDHVLAPVNDFYLIDDDASRMEPPKVFSRHAVEQGVLNVGPDEDAQATLTFTLPSGHSLKDIGSFRLFWSAQIGKELKKYETKFLRTAEPEVYYGESYPYNEYYWRDYPYYYPFGPLPQWEPTRTHRRDRD